MERTFRLIKRVNATQESWDIIDNFVQKIQSFDTKNEIVDILLNSDCFNAKGELKTGFHLIIIGKVNDDAFNLIMEEVERTYHEIHHFPAVDMRDDYNYSEISDSFVSLLVKEDAFLS